MMLKNVAEHLHKGTLVDAIKRRLRGGGSRQFSGPDTYHGKRAKDYVEVRVAQEKWHLEQRIMQELIAGMPDGISVLDVPFGTGRFVEMYLQKNMSVHGLEISRDMVAAASDQLGPAFGKCDVKIGSALSMPYEGSRFDLIVCCRFLGLLPLYMARQVLSEIHRTSNGTTILYFNVGKRGSLLGDLMAGARSFIKDPARKRAMVGGNMPEKRFLRLLDDFGFRVDDRRVIEDRPRNTYIFYVLSK